jgi:hypothetical protein
MSITDTTSGNTGSITGADITASQVPYTPQTSLWDWIKSHIQLSLAIIILPIIGAVVTYNIIMTDPIALNPTDKAITFRIDDREFTIPAASQITLPLSHGKHTVTMSGVVMGSFEFGWLDADSVINPTLSELVTVEVLYGDEMYANKLSHTTVTIAGHPYTGPYNFIPASLYVKKTWDYGAYEASPPSITTKSNYVIKKELHTAREFIEKSCYDGDPDESCQTE